MDESVIQTNIASARSRLNVAFQRRTPPVSQEMIDRANAHLQNLVNNAKISRYDKQEEAEKIIASGRFKAIIEREQDRVKQGREAIIGSPYTAMRRTVESNLFGIPESETIKRPIYAFLSDQVDGTADTYGEVKFVFQDTIRAVGTMTRSDSYNTLTQFPDLDPKVGSYAAVPLDRVSIEALAADLAFSHSLFGLEELLQCQTLDQLGIRLNNDYFEVQLHAPIGVQYIERIFAKPDIILSERAQQWARSQQIPIETMR